MASQFVNWIKSPAGRSYFFSTHFWGPVANWGLPIAALADMQKDESMISGVMSPTMAGYSSVFMAFAWQVQPRNYLLFACHATNATAQLIQTGRFVNYWYLGGKEKSTEQIATIEGSKVLSELQKSSQHVATAVSEEAQVASAALTTEAARLTNKVNDGAVQLDKTISDEAALIKSKGESLLHQAEKKGHELLEVAEKQAAAAKAHAAAGGQDALDRARAIAEQSKVDLGLAKAEVKEEVKEVKKKGWLW